MVYRLSRFRDETYFSDQSSDRCTMQMPNSEEFRTYCYGRRPALVPQEASEFALVREMQPLMPPSDSHLVSRLNSKPPSEQQAQIINKLKRPRSCAPYVRESVELEQEQEEHQMAIKRQQRIRSLRERDIQEESRRNHSAKILIAEERWSSREAREDTPHVSEVDPTDPMDTGMSGAGSIRCNNAPRSSQERAIATA